MTTAGLENKKRELKRQIRKRINKYLIERFHQRSIANRLFR